MKKKNKGTWWNCFPGKPFDKKNIFVNAKFVGACFEFKNWFFTKTTTSRVEFIVQTKRKQVFELN